MSVPIEAFERHVFEAPLDDLRARLGPTRGPAALGDAGWEYGTGREWLRDTCE